MAVERLLRGALNREQKDWRATSYRRGKEPPMHADSRGWLRQSSAFICVHRRFQSLSAVAPVTKLDHFVNLAANKWT